MKRKLISLAVSFAMVFTMAVTAIPVAAVEGTPISSLADLKAMENNPSGSYYLTKDISITDEDLNNEFKGIFRNENAPFTGTLNGNGHKIDGFMLSSLQYQEDMALIGFAKKAKFKNLTISNVYISAAHGGTAAGFVASSKECSFDKINTTGTITMKTRDSLDESVSAAGIVHYNHDNGSFTNCTNGINIKMDGFSQSGHSAAGVVLFGGTSKINNCTNKGNITVSYGGDNEWGGDVATAAGVVAFNSDKAIKNCTNKGNISIKINNSQTNFQVRAEAAGVILDCFSASLISCSNSGAISVTNNAKDFSGAQVAGVAKDVQYIGKTVSKCKNTGSISYTGKKVDYGDINVAGVVNNGAIIRETYNKGKVSVNSAVHARAGGISSWCSDMRNCYNAGTVSHKGTGEAGGLSATADVLGGYVKFNYSSGKVTGTAKKLFKGQLIGYYSGSWDVMKRNIFDNYYKTSGKPYGGQNFTWKPWFAKATKVSAFTKAKCPKLSSKYWKTSGGKLVLKNNK